MKKIILISFVLIIAIIFAGCGTINSGFTGVKIIDGIVQEEVMSEGRYGHLGARTDLIIVNNTRQNMEYNEKIFGESDDQTVVYAEGINITYQISKDASMWLVKNAGVDFQKNIIPSSKIASAVKNAMANIPTEKCTNRSYIEPAVKQEMQSAVDDYYYPNAITIIDISIKQMDYDEEYNRQIAQISALKKQAEANAIENTIRLENAKAIAEEEATKATAAKKTAEANAEVALITAESEANIAKIKAENEAEIIIINAEAQAEANKKISDSLTEKLNEYEKIHQWDGSLPNTILGESSIPMFNIEEQK